jgi:signal transduction histidine kinase
MRLGRYGTLGVALLAGTLGILTLLVAREDVAWSYAGTSTLGRAAELAAGWALVAVGLLFWTRRQGNRFGPLLVVAGLLWFLPEWSNPAVGVSAAFTAGFVGFVACVPVVAHAALTYPRGRLRSRAEAGVVIAAYAGALLPLGLLPATVFDPEAAGCADCPRNLALIRGDGGFFDAFNRYGLRLGLVWLGALGAVLVWRLARSRRAAAATVWPAHLAAIAYLALVAWDFQHSLQRGFLSTDSFERSLRHYEAGALVAFALAVGWELVREGEARAAVARLVIELGGQPRPGTVRDALARALGDPSLELAYRRGTADAYVDGSGRSVVVDPGPDRAITPIVHGETPVGVLVHDPTLLERLGLLQDVLAAARIAIENERLQAEVRAQLEELRASRARIVETGDAERQRLERDLHDGAQQRVLALSFDLRLAQANAKADADGALPALLASAVEEAQAALGDLRRLAHGIYPAILAEAGLEPALVALADEAPIPVEVKEMTAERYPAAVETAMYVTLAQAIDDAARRGATFVSVALRRDRDRLVVTVEDDGGARDSPLVHVNDRVGALGGAVEAAATELRAEIPCA